MDELPADLIDAAARAIAADRGHSDWKWDELLDGTKLVFRHHAEVALQPLAAAFNIAREREVRLMQAAQQVMSLLQAHGSGIVAHLLDTDDKAGQRLRKAIEASRMAVHLPLATPPGAPEPARLSPELHTRLIDAVEQPLRVHAAILKLAGRACGHLAEPPGGCCAGCEAWPCETTFQTAQPALDAFADSAQAPLHEIRANERRRLLQLVQAMSPGEMDGWAFRDQMLALLRSPG